MNLTQKITLFFILSLSILAEPMRIGFGDVCQTQELDQHDGQTACVCEVMKKEEWNKREYPFYKVGCQKWLGRQKCDKKIIVDVKEDVSSFLNSVTNLKTIKLGYVGHWFSSSGTINYTRERVLPLVEAHNVPVLYDNTACSGANDPIAIRNYLLSLDESLREKIIIKSNENVSVGEWASILSPFVTANAQITMCERGLQVPSCRDFKNRKCAVNLNHKDTVGCVDRNNQFQVYQCIDRGTLTGRKLERGNWTLVNMETNGVELEEKKLSHIEETISVTASAIFSYDQEYYSISDEEEENYTVEVVRENSPLSRQANLPIKWFSMEDGAEKERIFLESFGFVDYMLPNATLIENTYGVADDHSQKIQELLKEDKSIYVVRYNNPNLKTRITTDYQKALYFQEQYNPIVNYYGMNSEDIENILFRVLKN